MFSSFFPAKFDLDQISNFNPQEDHILKKNVNNVIILNFYRIDKVTSSEVINKGAIKKL